MMIDETFHDASGPPRRAILKRLAAATLGTLAIAGAIPAVAQAQAYPARPIRLVCPYPAGGATDVAARMLAQEMGKVLGQQVIVDNKPGAAGSLGADMVAKAPPDGYTLVFGGVGNLTLRPLIDPNLPYQPERDLVPISHVVNYDYLLVARAGMKIASTADLVAYAKANPGKLTYASSGSGGPQHLAMELLKTMAKIDLVHVPYKGDTPAVTDLVGGQVDLAITATPAVASFVKNGRVKLIAATNPMRSKTFPDAPTVHEAGVSGYEVQAYGGVLAPAGTPRAVVDKLHQTISTVLKNKEFRDRYYEAGIFPVGSTPAEFAALLRAETRKWAPIVKSSGVKVE